MLPRRRTARVGLVIVTLGLGCSSTSNTPSKDAAASFDGPPPATKLVDLPAADLHGLCLHYSPDGSGVVSCGGGVVNAGVLGLCTSVTSDCTATVATAQTCTAKLTADACNTKAYNVDFTTPECLVMRACTLSLCSVAACLCPDDASRNTCISTCQSYTGDFTLDCATCVAGLFSGYACPDFSQLQSDYDKCGAVCAQPDGGAAKTDGGAGRTDGGKARTDGAAGRG